MITLLLAPLPIVLSLFNPSLPELVALALVLLITLAMALVLAMAGTVNTESSSARKQQSLIKPSVANRVIETSAFRLAMPHFLHKKSRRHAALLLKQIGPYSSLRHPWVGRSSRKGSWFTLIAPVLPLNLQKITMVDTVNSPHTAGQNHTSRPNPSPHTTTDRSHCVSSSTAMFE
jgi:hypothetical protein